MTRLARLHLFGKALRPLAPALTVCLSILLPFFANSTRLHAQTNSSITGVVTDSSGAAIPGVEITLKNTATGIARVVKSDGAGRYTFSALGNGKYNITAVGTGFKTEELAAINLDVSQVLVENLSLAVGSKGEEISVEAATLTTDTETSSNGATLAESSVAELPLANRQFYTLVETAPGVAPPAQNSSMGFRGGMNINGAPETANMFIVNGTFNMDLGTNQNSFRPSVDTIQEFKVLSGGYSAEYGRMQGGQIIIVTKQGTNKYHGSAYEFIRNGAIEARQWSPSAPPAGAKSPAFRQNTFGATIGGPILPKLKDKAFFFFGFEGQSIAQEISAVSTVPTPYTMGTYNASTNSVTGGGCIPGTTANPYDPATGVKLTLTNTGACAGAPGMGYDITTSTMWNPSLYSAATPWGSTSGSTSLSSVSLGRLLAGLVYPAPNVPNAATTTACGANTCLATPANNYNFDEIRTENMREYNSRVDYRLSDKDSFFSSYSYFVDPAFEPDNSLCSSRTLPNFGCFTNQISTLANVGNIHIFTPNVLNTFTFGAVYFIQPRIQQDNTSIGTLWPGLPGAFTGVLANNLGTPSVTPSGGYTATGGQNNLPQQRNDTHFDIDDIVTWTHKAQTFKIGVQALIVKFTNSPSGSRGSLTFNPTTAFADQSTACPHCGSTGDPIGDLLLGIPVGVGQTPTAPKVYQRYNAFDFFFQDDWKIKSNLTLNLGARWEYDLPYSDKYGNMSTFSPSTGDALIGAGVTQGPLPVGGTVGTGGIGNPNGNFVLARSTGQKTVYQTDRHAIAPRVGFAWQPFHNEKTVVKGAYGTYFATAQSYNEFDSYGTQFPIRYSKTFAEAPYAGGAGAIFMANAFPTAALPTPGEAYCVQGSAGCNTPNPAGTPVGSGYCAAPCAQIPVVSGTQVDPHYLTAQADQWTLGIQRQVTSSTIAELVYIGNKGTHLSYGGNAVLNPNANPDAGLLNQNFSGSATAPKAISGAALQALRVYPQWGSIAIHKTGYNSEYEALQARVQMSAKRGATILVSYTYGKCEDGLVSAQNPIKQDGDKELCAADVRHRIVVSPVYPLPFGKGQQFLNSGIASAIFGGFQISGIYQYFTGRPFGVSDSSNQSSSDGGGDRPDLVPGMSLKGTDPINGAATHNKNEWFNVHALAYNPPGTFGNVAPNTIEGPGWDELDLTVGRTFAVKEWAKLQFKLDAFNLFNHPNLWNPTTTSYAGYSTFTSTAYPQVPGYCAAGATTATVTWNGVTNACTLGGGANGAGSLGAITQANNMREIQASLHIAF